jgi:hypothetical protein
MRIQRLIVAAAVSAIVVCAVAVTRPAEASLIVYNSRAAFDALGPTASIDWGVYGPAGTLISTPDFKTIGGLTFHGASSEGILYRHDEGTDYTGDFAPGDHLLTESGSLSDTFIVGFDSMAVRGFGMQVEPFSASGAWTGTIDVFTPGNVLLGTIAIGGNKTNAEDNSAPFYGIVSDSADIGYAYFWVDQSDPALPSKAGDIAINTTDVLVPEPSSLAMAGTAILFCLFAFAGSVRRRKV